MKHVEALRSVMALLREKYPYLAAVIDREFNVLAAASSTTLPAEPMMV